MKTSTNKKELIELDACEDGLKTFIEAHGDNEATFSQCLDSNGWSDVLWLLRKVEDQLSGNQKHDLRVFACNAALVNIEKVKPYCSDEDYQLIVNYLNNPTEEKRELACSAARSAMSAAWSAACSAERSAVSAAWSAAVSAAESAARAARSAEWAARSAAWSTEWSAPWSAESAARAEARASAWSAEWVSLMDEFTSELRDIFVKWEKQQ